MPRNLNLNEPVKIIGHIGQNQIDKLITIKFSERGLTLPIIPQGHGTEELFIYCLTEPLFTSALYQPNQVFYYDMQSNDALASYNKTEDVREGVLLGINFYKINADMKQENNMIIFRILLEKYFDEPYMNPLYPTQMMVEQGNFKIDLSLHIPIKTIPTFYSK